MVDHDPIPSKGGHATSNWQKLYYKKTQTNCVEGNFKLRSTRSILPMQLYFGK